MTTTSFHSRWDELQKSRGDALRKYHSEDSCGLWLRESLINHSCVPNCMWSQIGDHMFVRCSRAIAKGEELCISYTSCTLSFAERDETFRHWVSPDVGFSCACEYCHLCRSNSNLYHMEEEVFAAYANAAEMVAKANIPMSSAAETCLSSNRRIAILKAHEKLPLKLQHNTVAKVLIFEGTCLVSSGDYKGALRAFERVADIGCAVRGVSCFDHAVDFWRVVGAALSCVKVDKAKEALHNIYNTHFSSLPTADRSTAFECLTFKYAMPFYVTLRR